MSLYDLKTIVIKGALLDVQEDISKTHKPAWPLSSARLGRSDRRAYLPRHMFAILARLLLHKHDILAKLITLHKHLLLPSSKTVFLPLCDGHQPIS